MVSRVTRPRLSMLAVVAVVMSVGLAPGAAEGGDPWQDLDRWPAETPSPTGQSVAVECNPSGGGEVWPHARAELRLSQRNGTSRLTLKVRNAKPDTLYTVWLRLLGEDSEGNPYGGSPLTGIPVTPFVPSDALPDQVAATLPNPGDPDPINGFRTNRRGNGRVTIEVDFPVESGAYPFQRFPNFDHVKDDVALVNPVNVQRLGGMPASLRPVAIVDRSQAPATFLVASHCVDDLAHGLLPGPHENWFTWSP